MNDLEVRKTCWLYVIDHLCEKKEIGGITVNKYGKNPNDLLMWAQHLLENDHNIKLNEHNYDLKIKYRDNWPVEVIITLVIKGT